MSFFSYIPTDRHATSTRDLGYFASQSFPARRPPKHLQQRKPTSARHILVNPKNMTTQDPNYVVKVEKQKASGAGVGLKGERKLNLNGCCFESELDDVIQRLMRPTIASTFHRLGAPDREMAMGNSDNQLYKWTLPNIDYMWTSHGKVAGCKKTVRTGERPFTVFDERR